METRAMPRADVPTVPVESACSMVQRRQRESQSAASQDRAGNAASMRAVSRSNSASISGSVLGSMCRWCDMVTPAWLAWHSSRRLLGSELSPSMWSISVPGEWGSETGELR